MILDLHVHISAMTDGHGSMSRRLLDSAAFRFMRWRLGLVGEDAGTERALEAKLSATLAESGVDAAVVLAFDGVHDRDGNFDHRNTHLYVTNDYVIELCRRHDNMLFGASIHPYRKDAIQELERCIEAGAVLVKWLPPTQGMDPADDLCRPLYEAMAHHGIPLLCHSGGELSLPRVDDRLEDPGLVEPALQMGVKVILAHCGTRSSPFGKDYLPTFMRLAQDYEHCYGDTSAMTLPARAYGLRAVLKHPAVSQKLLHGSDWPIIAIPPLRDIGFANAWRLMQDPNWMRRDVKIKQLMGFDQAYWHRADKVVRSAK